MLMLKVMYQQYPQTDIFNGTSIIDTLGLYKVFKRRQEYSQ